MPVIFDEWDYNKALQALNSRQRQGDDATLRYVVEHDNWQEGEGWSGPQFRGGDKAANVIKEGISRDFTSKGAIPSVIRRHRRGVVGREPGWMVGLRRKLRKVTTPEGERVDETPTTEEQTAIEQAQELLLDWWNRQRALREFRKAVTHFNAVGRGPLRLYWPPAELKGGRMPLLSLHDAARRVFLLAPKPTEAAVVLDTWSMRRAGVYTFEDREGRPAVGLCYLNDEGKTVVRTLREGSSALTAQAPGLAQRARDYLTGDAPKPDASLALNGNLTLFELDGEPLITEPVKRNQKLLDKALTMLSHNMDEAGFREEVYLNAQPPGKTVMIDDPDGSGKQVEAFVRGSEPLDKGPGAVKFVRGIAYTERDEATGKVITHLATPSREVTDPVPVKSYTDTASEAYRNILEDTDQLHVQIAGDAASSGESRKQARDDYKKSLDETKSEVDYVGSAVMETFLSLTAIFAGRPGYFDGVRVSFDCRVDPGPLDSEDRRINLEEIKAGLKSEEEGMQYIGIADPDAMKEAILQEKKAKADAGIASPLNPAVEDKTGEGLPA